MKSHLFLFFALLLLSGSDLYAQWEQIGPSGGDITALAVIDSTLFAGTHGGGVFRSTDMGSHWASVSTGLSNGYINALIVRGTDLLAGTPLGIFRLTYNAGNWARSDSGISKMDVLSFAASTTSLFAGTEDGNILRSTDNGISWNIEASLSYHNSSVGISAMKIVGQ